MSELKSKIDADLKQNMKDRNQHVVTTLRGLLAAVKQVEVDTRTAPTDSKIIEIIQKEIKMRRDALQFAVEQNRQELIDQNTAEIALIQKYLGEQMSDTELENTIKAIIAGGANQIGAVMGALNKDHKGKFEGKKASELIKTLLG